MIRKLKLLTLLALVLLLVSSVWINLSLIRNNATLSRLLSEKGTVILSPSLTEMLLSDLKSADKVRLEEWGSFLYQFTDTNYNVASAGLNETLELYKLKERPARSNYFN